jgi:hypothetical protein
MVDPKACLIELPKRQKDPATGEWTTVYEAYLEVKYRVLMFRERYPHGAILSEEVRVDLDKGYARYRCVVIDGEGGKAIAHGTETAADFPDFAERAETRAVGRALALMGFGTAAAVDAPVASTNGHQASADESIIDANNAFVADDPPPPTTIPSEADLPCAGQEIALLKPAQLAMLIAKLARRVQDGEGDWVSLLYALESERARRVAAGQRPRPTPVQGEG